MLAVFYIRCSQMIGYQVYTCLLYTSIFVAAGVLYPVYDILLSPALAGAAMALSCVSVALSSLRLSSRF